MLYRASSARMSREWQKERKDDEDEKRKGGEEKNAEEDGRRGAGARLSENGQDK